MIDHPVQIPLFTPGGSPFSRETFARELRVSLLEHLSTVFGSLASERVRCPECRGEVRVLLQLSCPTAWCRCGWHVHLTETAGKQEAAHRV